MITCFFVSDLHGKTERYEKLLKAIIEEKPEAVFLGGDILPSGLYVYRHADLVYKDFISDYLIANLLRIKVELGAAYPRIFVILGNDDGRFVEPIMQDAAATGIWEYAHNGRFEFEDWVVYGYAYIPPTPFLLKDWERYDVSRYVDPGCVSPEEGKRFVPVSEHEKRYATIKDDLNKFAAEDNLEKAVFLFHAPPYKTKLDRAALDGHMIDNVPVDPHVGSVAIRQFIEKYQPWLTLHGHIHESSRLTGSWKDHIGRTWLLSAAYDGSELSLVKFDLEEPGNAIRELI
jgi:Icc-related predicted phosphoesterase